MTRTELREKIIDLLKDPSEFVTWGQQAEAIISLVLEKAAEKVDGMPCAPQQQMYDYWHGYRAALNYSAIAIRAMKDADDDR